MATRREADPGGRASAQKILVGEERVGVRDGPRERRAVRVRRSEAAKRGAKVAADDRRTRIEAIHPPRIGGAGARGILSSAGDTDTGARAVAP